MISALFLLQLASAQFGARDLQPADRASCEALAAAQAVSKEMRQRKLVTTVAPKMNWTERRGGCAVLSFRIAADGAVSDVRIVHATQDLIGKSAQRAVREWKYEPGKAEAGATYVLFALTHD